MLSKNDIVYSCEYGHTLPVRLANLQHGIKFDEVVYEALLKSVYFWWNHSKKWKADIFWYRHYRKQYHLCYVIRAWVV